MTDRAHNRVLACALVWLLVGLMHGLTRDADGAWLPALAAASVLVAMLFQRAALSAGAIAWIVTVSAGLTITLIVFKPFGLLHNWHFVGGFRLFAGGPPRWLTAAQELAILAVTVVILATTIPVIRRLRSQNG